MFPYNLFEFGAEVFGIITIPRLSSFFSSSNVSSFSFIACSISLRTYLFPRKHQKNIREKGKWKTQRKSIKNQLENAKIIEQEKKTTQRKYLEGIMTLKERSKGTIPHNAA